MSSPSVIIALFVAVAITIALAALIIALFDAHHPCHCLLQLNLLPGLSSLPTTLVADAIALFVNVAVP
jgi:hypothetical protein